MTDSSRGPLSSWRGEFRRLDSCPWPGPRPLEEGERSQLIGREEDLETLVDRIYENRLVILSGVSGAGKSSFLNAGLVPDLKDGQFLPLTVRNWTVKEGMDLEQHIVSKVRISADLIDPASEGDDFWQAIDAVSESTAVLILDQFEELIRYREDLFNEAIELIDRLLTYRDIRIVVSLRTEYIHRLEPLERKVAARRLMQFYLLPLKDTVTARKIIASAEPLELGLPTISANAAAKLESMWESAAQNQLGAPSLLELQATLYSLHHLADGSTVRSEQVRGMQRRLELSDAADRAFFAGGLRESITKKLDVCAAACRSTAGGLDAYLVEGTRSVAQRAVPFLSSAGYKVPQEEWELARKALRRELTELGFEGDSRDVARQIFRSLRHGTRAEHDPSTPSEPTQGSSGENHDHTGQEDDLLVMPREVLSKELKRSPWPSPDARSPERPIVNDKDGLSSGPMFGAPPLAVLVEELRRAAFALEWLIEAKIVRSTTSDKDSTMFSLIHDGFGEALVRWSQANETDPSHTLHQLTVSRGRTFDWTGEASSSFDGGEKHKSIVNLRLQHCKITAAFRRVAFVNCDFRGSRFVDCDFEGVAFVNCLLDNAVLEECTFIGDASTTPPKTVEDVAPSFEIPAEKSEVAAYLHFRGLDVGSYEENQESASYHWFSDTSGFPAVPKGVATSRVSDLMLEDVLPSGGITVLGGRVSSLIVYRCETEDQGSIAFHHVQGAGLDIVEYEGRDEDDEDQEAPSVKIYGAQLRSLTVSRDPDEFGPDGKPDALTKGSRRLNIRIEESLVVDAVFGRYLEGNATFDHCRVWMLLNANSQDAENAGDRDTVGGFSVDLVNCQYWAIANATKIDFATSIPAEAFATDERFKPPNEKHRPDRLTESPDTNRAELPRVVELMSYHLRPEEFSRPKPPVSESEQDGEHA